MQTKLLVAGLVSVMGLAVSGCTNKCSTGVDANNDKGGLAGAMQDCKTVYFGFDKSNLTAKAKDRVKQQYEILNKNGQPEISVAGHTDSRGTQDYNLALGAARAEAVKAELSGLGYDSAKISTTSFGKESPAFANAKTEQEHSLNRRTETEAAK